MAVDPRRAWGRSVLVDAEEPARHGAAFSIERGPVTRRSPRRGRLCFVAPMATRPSISLPVVGLLVAAVAVALVLVARSGPLPVGLGWLALAPAAALVVARPARAIAIGAAVAYVAILDWAYTSHF